MECCDRLGSTRKRGVWRNVCLAAGAGVHFTHRFSEVELSYTYDSQTHLVRAYLIFLRNTFIISLLSI